MEDKELNRFTVQGRDTLVQVLPGSGNAGSRGPSANDCATNQISYPVDFQVGEETAATGTTATYGTPRGETTSKTKTSEAEHGQSMGDTEVYGTPVGETMLQRRMGLSMDFERNVVMTERDRMAFFSPRTSIPRSPPMTPSSENNFEDEVFDTSLIYNLIGRDVDKDEKGKDDGNTITVGANSPAKKKRKRELIHNTGDENNGDTTELNAVLKAIEMVTNKTEQIKQLVKEKTKTSLEIRAATRELNNMVENLNRKAAILKVNHNSLVAKVKEHEKSAAMQANEDTGTRKESKSIGVQAEDDDIKITLSQQREDCCREIESQMEEKTGWTGLSKIIDHDWPRKCFKNTDVTVKATYRDLHGDLAVIINPSTITTGAMAEDIIASYPDITRLMTEGLEEGNIEYVKTNTVRTSKGQTEESSKMLYVLPYKLEQDGVDDICKLYELINKLENQTSIHSTNLLKLVALGNLNTDYLRKCAEFAFRGTEKKIEILTVEVNKKSRHKSLSRKERPQIEKVIIKSEGKQYADILRTIKNNVNIDEVGIKVKNIKKTAKGEVMLEIEGGKDKAEALKQAIKNSNGDTKVTIRNNDDVIHVSGIDGDVNDAEIAKAIKESVGDANEGDIKILSTRQNLDGSQNAIISLRKGIATDLIAKGTIRIGWVHCRVRLRVNVTRCYRCLEFGHLTHECKGQDKTRICLKCGQEGHKARNCQNTNFCLTCKISGHRADQMKCPHYRKLVNEKCNKIANGQRSRYASIASERY